MTPTPRQREEWESNKSKSLEEIKDAIEYYECRIQDSEFRLEELKKELDMIKARTFEDSYFEFLAEIVS